MIEGIEALLALERTGTISEAAAQLRLTQSAVSKRIQGLEAEMKMKLIEPDGRRVRLTGKGQIFLNKARLLMLELKSLKDVETENDRPVYSIALSDSIAASWGPRLIRQCTQVLKNIELEIHVHRSTLVEENIRLGRYHLGLCISQTNDPQIVSDLILEEPMVLIRSPLVQSESKLYTIERNSGSWKALEEKVLKHAKLRTFEIFHVESFAAIIQMVREGYGYGLVPLGIAQTMNLPKKDIIALSPQIKRQIRLMSRKNMANQAPIQKFKETLQKLAKELR